MFNRKVEQLQATDDDKRDVKMEMALAFCCGYLRKTKLEPRQFPHWKPLPYKFSCVTTCILIVTFSTLFSDRVLNKTLGIDPSGTNPTGSMCTNDDMQTKVDHIIDSFLNTTQMTEAISQTQVTKRFLEALQNDTALWGEEGYECESAPRTKEEFRNASGYATEMGLHYFPGYCTTARDEALKAARLQKCFKPFCATGVVVDLEAIVPMNGDITGLDDLEGQINNAGKAMQNVGEYAQKLSPQCDGCDAGFMAWAGTKAFFGNEEGAKNDLWNRLGVDGKDELLDAVGSAENAFDGIDLGSIGVTNATFTYENKEEEFCKEHEIPCPDYSRYDELTDVVKDYSFEKLNKFSDAAIEFAAPTVNLAKAEVSEQYVNFVKLLIRQMEIASFLYAGYKCLTLFFPTPLIVFKEGIINEIKGFVFGAKKATFVVACLALWWGIQYFRTFNIFLTFEVYMKVFLQDPCVARQEYVRAIGAQYSMTCNTLITARDQWKNSKTTIDNIIKLAGIMADCCKISCPYVHRNVEVFNNTTDAHQMMLNSYGFAYNDLCGDAGCYLPTNVSFLGNLTACSDSNFVRREIIKLNDASTVSWWDVWIRSGVLASILLSAGVANLGVNLVNLADPLMICDGKYEGPPKNFNFQEQEVKSLMREKILGLKMSAFGGVVFWGLFMNLMMINIVLGNSNSFTDERKDDAAIGAIMLVLSILPVLAAHALTWHLSKKVIMLKEYHRKKSDNDDDPENDDAAIGDLAGQVAAGFDSGLSATQA